MTLCEQLHWKTPQGSSRIQFALSVLEELERLSILTLPPKRTSGRGPQKPIQCCSLTDPQPAIEGPLADLTPLKLQLASSAEHVAAWNTWVQRYHPLGYRRPLGPPPALLPARPRHQRKLGWLLFGFAARSVACRDAWIGWQGQAHRKHLDLVVRNSRFLVFPWVRVPCLASKALGLAVRQLPKNWQRRHGSRPALVETFVDPQRYKATCYRAANWQFRGLTQGTKAKGKAPAKTPKGVYVYPLRPDWRTVLLHGPSAAARRRQPAAGDGFVRMWQGILGTMVHVASEHDREWLQRQRVIHTLLVVLFVFRLVFAHDRQGFALTLAEL